MEDLAGGEAGRRNADGCGGVLAIRSPHRPPGEITMQRRRFGSSGLKVSLVGLGCNSFGARVDGPAAKEIVAKALDLGIDFFDTSDIYGPTPMVVQKFDDYSETLLGAALGGRRRDAVVATKCGLPADREGRNRGGSRRNVFRAVEGSLRRLGSDWIDLLYLHAPDPETPIAETLMAFGDLIRQGKVRYVASSNFAAWQVVEAHYAARELNLAGFIGCENEWNLLERGIEKELVPAARACGLGIVPFFPLASGLLTGKYRKDAMPKGARLTEGAWFAEHHGLARNWDKVEALRAFCEARGRTMTELAFSWLAARPEVASIIAGVTRLEQVEQNARAADWALGAAELAELDRITA
jgi:aryl-alcohol dehydrogenase-like predicted oxidoreductase